MTSMTQRPLIVAFHGTAAHSPVTTCASIPIRGGANELSGKFLGSTELGAAISHVMAGRDIRCAVAFWGTGASAHLFPSGGLRDAKIICDLALGGTNPGELHIMGAPSNKTILDRKSVVSGKSVTVSVEI